MGRAHVTVVQPQHLLTAGQPDLSFGVNGVVRFDVPNTPSREDFRTMAILPDGQAVVFGSSSLGDAASSSHQTRVRISTAGNVLESRIDDPRRLGYKHAQVLPSGKILMVGSGQFDGIGQIIIARYNADLSLDSTFGFANAGIAYTGFRGEVRAITIAEDGKIYMAGWWNDHFVTLRFLSDGSIDTSFANNGMAELIFPASFLSEAMAVEALSNGKVLVAGYNYDSRANAILVRYNENGTLDTSFANAGIFSSPFGTEGTQFLAMSVNNQGSILALGTMSSETPRFLVAKFQPNGDLDTNFSEDGFSIIDRPMHGLSGDAAAIRELQDGHILLYKNAFARLNVNGTLDTSYGVDGYAMPHYDEALLTPIYESAKVHLFPNGSALIGGTADNRMIPGQGYHQVAVMRVGPDGKRDNSFANNGTRVVPPGFPSGVGTLAGVAHAVHPDGRIFIAASSSRGDGDLALASVSPDGKIPSAVREASTLHWDRARILALQPDGKAVLAGISANDGLIVARYREDNRFLDSSFGTSGLMIEPYIMVRPSEMLFQPDGKILISARESSGGPHDNFTVIRLNANGSLDSSFGTAGVATIDLGGNLSDEYRCAMVLLEDGKIVLAGYAHPIDSTVVRLLPNGTIDTTFGNAGIVRLNDFYSQSNKYLLTQPDGKLLVGSGRRVYRLNSDGSIDASYGTDGNVYRNAGVWMRGMVQDTDGKLTFLAETQPVTLSRRNADGSPDLQFGVGGVSQLDFGDMMDVQDISISNGRILVSGSVDGYAYIAAFKQYNQVSRFEISGPLSAQLGEPFSLTVESINAVAQRATDYAGTIRFVSTDPAANLPNDYTFSPSDQGLRVFSNEFRFRTLGTQTVQAIDTQNGRILGTFSVSVTVGSSSWIGDGSNRDFHNPINWQDGIVPGPDKAAIIPDLPGDQPIVISAATVLHSIQSSQSIWLEGSTLTLNAPSQIAGELRVINGIAIIQSTLDVGSLQLDGGELHGNGTLNGTLLNSGTVSPGNSPGTVTINGDYQQSSNGVLEVEVAGLNPGDALGQGTDFDRLIVYGQVNLNGALAVSLLNAFQPTLGDSIVIIENDGTDSITGQFSGLAEGALTWSGAYGFSISYSGGDGNDVSLILAFIATAIWDGGGNDLQWNTPANWLGDQVPSSQDRVLIGNLGHNDPIVIVGGEARADWLTSQQPLAIFSTLAIGSNAQFNSDVGIWGALTVQGIATVTGHLTLNQYGRLTGPGSLTAAGGSLFEMNGHNQRLDGGFEFINPIGSTSVWRNYGRIDLNTGSVFTNQGTILIEGDINVGGDLDSTAFYNHGTIRKTGGDTSTNTLGSWFATVLMVNTGLISVEQGTVSLGWNGDMPVENTGSIAGVLGASVNFRGRLTSSGSIDADRVIFEQATTLVSGSLSANHLFVSNNTQITGEIVSLHNVNVGGTLNLNEATFLGTSRQWNNLFVTGTLMTDEDLTTTGDYHQLSYGQLTGTGSLTAAGGSLFEMYGHNQRLNGGFEFINPVGSTSVWRNYGRIDLNTGSVFTNQGTILIEGDINVGGDLDSTAFYNHGTIRKTGGDTSTNTLGSWFATVLLVNTGLISVEEGTVSLGWNGDMPVENTGSIVGVLGASVNFRGRLTSSGSIDADRVIFEQATTLVSGSLSANHLFVSNNTQITGEIVSLHNVNVGGTLNLNEATFLGTSRQWNNLFITGTLMTDEDLTTTGDYHQLSFGQLTGTGSLTAAGGSLFEMYGHNQRLNGGFEFINPVGSTSVWRNYGRIDLNTGSVFTNQGTILIEGDINVGGDLDSTAFYNHGTIRKTGGDTSTNTLGSWFATVLMVNTGLISVEQGTVSLGWNGDMPVENTGSIVGVLGASVNFRGRLTSSGSIDADRVIFEQATTLVSGSLSANHLFVSNNTQITGEIVSLHNVNVGGTLNLNEATFLGTSRQWNNLFITGTLITDEDLTTTGDYHQLSFGQLTGTGSLTAAGGSLFEMYGHNQRLNGGFEFINPVGSVSVWRNYGWVDLRSGSIFTNLGELRIEGDVGVGGDLDSTAFYNHGTIRKTGGDTSTNTLGSWFATVLMVNTGLISVEQGTISLGWNGDMPVENTGSIAGVLGASVNFRGRLTSSGSIDADRVIFEQATTLVSGSLSANHLFVSNNTQITGEIVSLHNVNVGGTLNLNEATFLGTSRQWNNLFITGTLITDEDLTTTGDYHQLSFGQLTGTGSLTAAGGSLFEMYGHNQRLNGGFEFINPVGSVTVWRNYGWVDLRSGSIFTNLGELRIEGDVGVGGDLDSTAFYNHGTIRKTGGDTSTNTLGSWFATVLLVNTGLISVEQGTISLGWNGDMPVENTGSIAGVLGASVNFRGRLTSSGSIDADRVIFEQATTLVSGSLSANHLFVSNNTQITGEIVSLHNVNVGGTLNLNEATFLGTSRQWNNLFITGTLMTDEDLTTTGDYHQLSFGQLTGTGSLTAAGGSLFEMYGHNQRLNGGFEFINPVGSVTVWRNYGWVDLRSGSIFTNLGELRIEGDVGVGGDLDSTAFYNHGTIRKTGGDTSTNTLGSWFATVLMVNTGLISVEQGTVSLGWNGDMPVENTGSIVGVLGASVNFRGRLTSSGSIDADRVIFEQATTLVSGSLSANQLFVSNNTQITGEIVSLVDLNVSGRLDITLASLTTNAKALNHLTLTGTLVTDEDLSVVNGFSYGFNGRLVGAINQGGLTLQSNTLFNTNLILENFDLKNAGNLLWSAGHIQFVGDGGGFHNLPGARFETNFDGTFGTIDGNRVEFVNDGQLVKSADTGATYLAMLLYNRGLVQVDQGRIVLGFGYATNRIEPPCTGCEIPPDRGREYRDVFRDPVNTPVQVPGSFTQTVDGELVVQIAGHTPPGEYGNPSTDYGQLVVTGEVSLAGQLGIELIQGFNPQPGQKFMIIENLSASPTQGHFLNLLQGQPIDLGVHRFLISYTGGDGNDVVLTSALTNGLPDSSAGGPYSLVEGGQLTLDASQSSDPDQDPLSFTWDVNGDGIYGDAVGVNPTLMWGDLNALGIDDGFAQFNVSVKVSDGINDAVTSVPVGLTIQNSAPSVVLTASLDGYSGVAGQVRSFSVSATDPSSVDQSSNFDYLIDWGDGTAVETIVAGATSTVSHIYPAAGNYLVTVQAFDKDGMSGSYSRTITIQNIELQGDVMAVGGSNTNDAFTISKNLDETLRVQRGTTVFPNFAAPAAGLLLFGAQGNDTLLINGTGSSDIFLLESNQITWNGTLFTSLSLEQWTINGQAGNDSFTHISGIFGIDGGSGADTLKGHDSPSIWNLLGSNLGSVNGLTFARIENLTGGSDADLFLFSPTGSISGNLQGGDGMDQIDYSLRNTSVAINFGTSTATATGGFTSIEAFRGTPLANSAFTGAAADNLWVIEGQNRGSYNGTTTLLDISTWTGGSLGDRFHFEPAGKLTDSVSGGNGVDVLDFGSWSLPVEIDLNEAAVTYVSGFSGIESFIGGDGKDTLKGRNANTNWSIDGINTGSLGATRFTAIENLVGGSLNDNFRLMTDSAAIETLDGGSGLNTITGFSKSNEWRLTGEGIGKLNDAIEFVRVGNLVGGALDDRFALADGASFLSINGGGQVNRDIMDYSLVSDAVTVDLATTSTNGISKFVGVEQFIGGPGLTDRMIGRNANQNWTLAGSGVGAVGAVVFEGFEHLQGGTANDTLSLTGYASGVAFEGGPGTDTVVGANQSNTWVLTAFGTGSVNGFTFSGTESLTGNSQMDRFHILQDAGVAGALNGGLGNNTLDYSAWNSPVTVNLGTRVGTGVGGAIVNITMVLGGSAGDALTAAGTASVLIGGGGNDLLLGGSGRNVLIGGLDADRLEGLGGDDLMIGGRTAFDTDVDSLWLILEEWKSSRTYAQRVANLRGLGTNDRNNGTIYLKRDAVTTVFGDIDALDEMLGGTGRDWYFADTEDALLDLVASGSSAEEVD